ncbi:hypothetical protein B0T16DRAFT_444130 [Cercophora newfieldiana]|uniref:DUF7357 domain-containing protein n=1 Tax=Cercophora newfieldiana TaxID=92897 RepID=A0AA39YI62_9PEZI|nr:hypothetical protein B0T16DRAFT_444130 [Cercophora newfieldiana]
MPNSNMRLRLVVRRHALPEVRVVFCVQLENDPTIANLLEQVNDVIPLESTEWGLEDYAVELRDPAGHSFDCMHFQQVSVVLKNDEEVFIRPLVTEDRKKRRLSGRDQISTDGKHLIDGIAFGRPRLKNPRDRPPIEIPPLKRRRITYDDEEPGDIDEDDRDVPLLLMEHGEDDDDDASDYKGFEDEEDDEFDGEVDDDLEEDGDIDVEDELDELELADELRDLQKENEQLRDSYMDGDDDALSLPDVESSKNGTNAPTEQAKLDLAVLDKITALRAAFPSAPVPLCEKTLLQCNKDSKKAYNLLLTTRMPVLSFHGMQEHEKRLQLGATTRTLGESAGGNAIEEDDDDEVSGSDAESVSSLVKHHDQHGFPSGSILDGSASAHLAETLRKKGKAVKMPVHTRFDEDEVAAPADNVGYLPLFNEPASDESEDAPSESPEFDIEKEDSESDDESYDGRTISSSTDTDDDDDDDDSDSGPEVESSKRKPEPQGGVKVSKKRRRASVSESEGGPEDGDREENESSSSSDEDDSDDSEESDSSSESSDSDGDSSDDDDEHEGTGNNEAGDSADEDASSHDSSSDSSSSDSDSDSEAEQKTLPKAPTATDATSRPIAEVVAQATESAPLDRRHSPPTESAAPVAPLQGLTATQRRNARRRAKNKSMKAAAAGGSDSGHVSSASASHDTPTSASIAAKKAALLERLGLLDEPVSQSPSNYEGGDKDEGTPRTASRPSPSEALASSQRKSKLDLGAGRRMLFNSLGLKNPKTKADEDKIRESLMKDVRVHNNHRLENADTLAGEEHSNQSTAQKEDPDAWREKITYSAVECCEEGIELSEPPFPFVQRWDPQQRFGKGRGKRKKRNNQDFYEEEPSPKKRRYADQHEYLDGDSYFSAAGETTNADITLNYDDEEPAPEAMEADGAEDSQNAEGAVDEDDLPSLPDDLSTLPLVKEGDVKPGMVLTWKQFLLSKATNWQPQVLSMTGGVIDVHGSGNFRVRLAIRDRNLDRNEASYDDDGNRVYDKFELPGMDDEAEGDEALGYRTISILDMIEPRVLQGVEQESRDAEVSEQRAVSEHIQSVPKPLEREVTRSATDLSTTLDHEPSQTKPHDQMDVDGQHSGETAIPETILEVTEEAQPAELRMSISEERRREISEIITDAGFRKDVDPSLEQQEDLSSPSRQLGEEMSQDRTFGDTTVGTVVAASFSSNAPLLEHDTQQPSLGTTNGTSFVSDYAESQPIVLEPFHGFSDEPDHDSFPASRVGYPRLDVLHSDGGSVVSGRQPDPGFSFQSNSEDPISHLDESRETVNEISDLVRDPHGERGNSAVPNDTVPNSPEISSVDSFPSLSEVFVTASTPGSTPVLTNAAILAATKARKSAVSLDLGYDEVIQLLDHCDDESPDDSEGSNAQDSRERENRDGEDEDEGEESDEQESTFTQEGGRRLSSAARQLVKRPIEKPDIVKIKKEISHSQAARRIPPKPMQGTRVAREAPPPRPRIPRASQPSSFIPPGAEIISILDSSEPEVFEHYADDSIDEDYEGEEGKEEESQMPNGSGWVNKDTNYRTHKGAARGASVPAAASAPRQPVARKPYASQSRALGPRHSKKSMARVF